MGTFPFGIKGNSLIHVFFMISECEGAKPWVHSGSVLMFGGQYVLLHFVFQLCAIKSEENFSVVVSSWSNSQGSTSLGVGGIGSAVSSARICGCSQTSFHSSPATFALACAGVICWWDVLSVKRCSSTMGLIVVGSYVLSTSISVGSVIVGGVISGEFIATRFFRGLGDKTTMFPAGGHGLGLLVVSSCVSIGERSELFERLSSSCSPEVSKGRGIVDFIGS